MTTVASLIKDILRGLQICRWSLGCNCGLWNRPGFQSWKILKNSWGRDRDDYTWRNDSFIPAVWYHWPSETWCRRPGLAWGRFFFFFFHILMTSTKNFVFFHRSLCVDALHEKFLQTCLVSWLDIWYFLVRRYDFLSLQSDDSLLVTEWMNLSLQAMRWVHCEVQNGFWLQVR